MEKRPKPAEFVGDGLQLNGKAIHEGDRFWAVPRKNAKGEVFVSKEIAPLVGDDNQLYGAQLRWEYQLLQRLDGISVPKPYAFVSDPYPCLILEHVPGQSLSKHIRALHGSEAGLPARGNHHSPQFRRLLEAVMQACALAH